MEEVFIKISNLFQFKKFRPASALVQRPNFRRRELHPLGYLLGDKEIAFIEDPKTGLFEVLL